MKPGQWIPIVAASPEHALEKMGLKPDDAIVVAQQAGPFTIYRVLVKEKPQLRDLVIQGIRNWGSLDYCFKRGDMNAKSYLTYENWLNSLEDDELLAAYDRVRDAYKDSRTPL